MSSIYRMQKLLTSVAPYIHLQQFEGLVKNVLTAIFFMSHPQPNFSCFLFLKHREKESTSEINNPKNMRLCYHLKECARNPF
uniref:WD and tetratricopeptide repeats protein 1 isoform X4 n=1 Tax=Rhizophora mucronata TaxID=61149 RepID=A0A2P2M891_RHIMU